MDWFAPIDAYCERTASGLWGEPLNALSNLAFLAVAAYGFRIARRARSDWPVWCLVMLVGLVGVGSLAFHTFANTWSMIADVAPITAFIYGYFAFALRQFLGLSLALTGSLQALLLALNIAVAMVVPRGLLNGSIAYVPALVAAFAVALAARSISRAAFTHLAAAAILFAASLVFRTADGLVCSLIPVGTHFVWHILNALVLGLYLEAAVRFGQKEASRKELTPEDKPSGVQS